MPAENEDRREDEVLLTGMMTITADDIKAAADGKKKTCATRMDLYNGGVLRQWFGRVVVDIAGMRLREPQVRIMADHYHPVGFATQIDSGSGRVKIAGEIIRDPDDTLAMQIINKAAAGFIWEASIGARMLRVEMLSEDETAVVNGQEVVGPLRIARESELMEGSVVVFGEDSQGTAVDIAARRQNQKEPIMAKENKTDDKGDGTIEANAQSPALTQVAASAPVAPAPVDPVKEAVEAIRIAAAAEMDRISTIQAIETVDEETKKIQAQAIKEGWNASKAELHLLRAIRTAPAIVPSRDANVTSDVIEASIRMHCGNERSDIIEGGYNEETLDRAHKFRITGIKSMIEAHCHQHGLPVPNLRASQDEWVKAAFGFSATSVTTLLSNVANKVSLGAFNMVPSAAVQVARKLTANDFKTHTGVRLTGKRQFEEVGPGGELKSGAYADDSYTYLCKTYGRILGLTRQMFINDDLGAFLETGRLLGEGAFLARESVFWTFFLTNPNTSDGKAIFHADHNNLDTSTAGVDDAGYSLATIAMQEQTESSGTVDGADGAPIMVVPDRVLVPPALSKAAMKMYVSNNLIAYNADDTTTTLQADANVDKGMYRPVMSPYLAASNGGDDADWYMFAQNIDAFGISYLNGQEAPVIEEAVMSAEYLGQAMRGFFDFGVNTIDYQGAQKMSDA